MFNQGAEQIGVMSHNGGLLSLAPSLLKIGGLWRRTIATIQVAVPAVMLPNTRYQVFAVDAGGGAVSLVVSINENSVGPAGYTRWALVGSFYSTGHTVPVWGAFVNISGVPNTRPWYGGLCQLTQNGGGAITKPGAPDEDQVIFTRQGALVKMEWSFSKAGAGGSAPGGNWEYNTLNVLPTDDSLIPGITQEDTNNGIAGITTPTDGRNLNVFYNNNNKWCFRYTTPSNVVASNTTHPFAAGTFRFGGSWSYPVAAWSVTAIKDL